VATPKSKRLVGLLANFSSLEIRDLLVSSIVVVVEKRNSVTNAMIQFLHCVPHLISALWWTRLFTHINMVGSIRRLSTTL
jgi:hypothetical protein